MKKIFRILRNAFYVLVCAVFALVVFVTVSGAKGYSVASNSMSPEFNKGDVVFVKETPFEDLKKGDIVTVEFKTGDGTYTHRIVSIDYVKKEIRTAGDNTGVIDTESADSQQIKGKVWFSVPVLGYLSLLLTNTTYAAVVVIFVLLVMAVGFVMGKYYKNKTRGDENEHSEEKDN